MLFENMDKMTPVLKYLLISILLFAVTPLSQSQNTQKLTDKYKFKVSAKFGYHDKDNEGQKYFPGAFLGDAGFHWKFSKYWSAGAFGEYWQTTTDIEQRPNIYYSTHYKAYHFGAQVFFISSHERFDINIGATAGKYTIHYEYTGVSSTDNYLSLGLVFAPEYRLTNRFSIAAEISYDRLVNNDQHASLFNFKLGPAFRF